MPALAKAYLEWQDKPEGEEMETSELASQFRCVAIHTFGQLCSVVKFAHYETNTRGVDHEVNYLVDQEPNELANVSLIRHGLLGTAPETPSMAISLDTLELYHRLRRQQGQLSIQAMVKTLCDLHNVSLYYIHAL